MVYVTIALALGVSVGLLSVFQALWLKATGIPDAKNVVRYTLHHRGSGLWLSGPIYQALLRNASMKNISAWRVSSFRVRTQNEYIEANGYDVTADAFSIFELKPHLGRFFGEAEDSTGGGRNGWTAVLSYPFWKSHFAASPNVIGQVVFVDGTPVRIVGVLPREFTGITPLFQANIFNPSDRT
jgi:putative ABC transport system permease protein